MEKFVVLGDRIKSSRKKKGYTQAQLAEAVGVSPTAITSWETNTYSPEGLNLKKLASILSVSGRRLQ